jgi:Xaa-Pro dipeptidase
MVLSVEPPVYLAEEKLGARVIDNVLVTATGCEVLSRHPLELCVVGG